MPERLQDMPNDYLVYAVPGTEDRVQYWSRGTSVFGATFHYGAFPFDRQRLTFRIATEVRLSSLWVLDYQCGTTSQQLCQDLTHEYHLTHVALQYLPQLDGDDSLQLIGPSGLNAVPGGFRQGNPHEQSTMKDVADMFGPVRYIPWEIPQ